MDRATRPSQQPVWNGPFIGTLSFLRKYHLEFESDMLL
jgi:hypothetical protein